jgi:hypothetical protein
MNHKQTKAQQIADCIQIAAVYYRTTPEAILSQNYSVPDAAKDARHILWWHFYSCGMSYEAIGNLPWKRSYETIRRGARRAALMLVDRHHFVVARLPRIQTTLVISNV